MKTWQYYAIGIGVLAAIAFIKRKSIVRVIKKLTRNQYVDTYSALMKSVTKGTGLLPSVMMAQGILESNSGNSLLSSKHNNHFGIKADVSWNGQIARMDTVEYVKGKPVKIVAKFRRYVTPKEGFIDRVNFLKKFSRYRNAGVFSARNAEEQTTALQRAGYATDPNYAKLLMKIIDKYKLKSLDK